MRKSPGAESAPLGPILLAVLSIGLGTACRSSCKKTPGPLTRGDSKTVSSPAGQPPPAAPMAAAPHLSPPVTLLQLNQTAYHTRIHLASDAIYLLTMEGAYRLVQGLEPQETKLDLSDIGVATPSAFIYWSNGYFWLAPKRGGPPGRLARVKDRPLFIVSVEERFAWIGPDEQGHHTVYALRGGSPNAVHVASGLVVAATMVDDRVVFLERPDSVSWRLGSVGRGGGPPAFTTARKGRYPAMLAAAEDVYYYYFDDKDTSEVWAVSPDLRHERVVAKNVICSPLAVADRVFCGHVEGLFEISPTSGLPKLVYPSVGGSITAVAADQKRIVWVSDVGREKLAVMMLTR